MNELSVQSNKFQGPSTYYNWMLTANTITSTISLPLAGGLSDIFGRRWFMISGGVISLLSAIISLAAQNVDTMIAASAIGGLGRYKRPSLSFAVHH